MLDKARLPQSGHAFVLLIALILFTKIVADKAKAVVAIQALNSIPVARGAILLQLVVGISDTGEPHAPTRTTMPDHGYLVGWIASMAERREPRDRDLRPKHTLLLLRKLGAALKTVPFPHLPYLQSEPFKSRAIAFVLVAALCLAAVWERHLIAASPAAPVPVIGPGSVAYDMTVARQTIRSQQVNNVVALFGDSHTVALATSNLGANTENFGINSDTIAGLAKRLPLYSLKGANAVVIEIGINDAVHMAPDRFGSEYATLLGRLPNNLPVVAVAIFPVRDTAIKPKQIQRMNASMAAACRHYPNCRYLDLALSLAAPDGLLKIQYAEPDGVHLTASGYKIWSDELQRTIRAAIRVLVNASSRLPAQVRPTN